LTNIVADIKRDHARKVFDNDKEHGHGHIHEYENKYENGPSQAAERQREGNY